MKRSIGTYVEVLWRRLRPADGVRALQYFNLVRFGAALLAAVILAKSGLSPEAIALYEGWLFFANLSTFYWIIGGQNAVLRLFPLLDAERGRAFFQAVWLVWFFFSAVVALFLWGWGADFFVGLTRFELLPARGWLALFVWFQVPAWLAQAWYLLHARHGALVRYAAVVFGLQVCAVAVPLWWGMGLQGVFVALTLLALGKMCWSARLVFRQGPLWPWWAGAGRWLYAALPLMAHVLVGQSVDYIDGLIVSSRMEERWFAIFRYGSRELPLSLLLVGAVVTGSIPLVAKGGAAVLSVVRQRVVRLWRLLFPLSMLLMWVSPTAFRLVYSEAFEASARVFNVYLLLVGSRVLLPQVVLLGLGQGRVLVQSALLETALNVGLSLWWVQGWGLTGIAMASVVAYLFHKLWLMGWVWLRLGIAPQAYWQWPEWLLWNAALWACWWLAGYVGV